MLHMRVQLHSWVLAFDMRAAAILETGPFVPTAAHNSRSGNKNGTCGGLARTRKGGKLAMLMNSMPSIATSDGPNVLTSRHTLQHCLGRSRHRIASHLIAPAVTDQIAA